MKIAISGFGTIAREQHVPAIAATPGLDLIAVASPHGGLDGVPWYPTLEELLANEPTVDSVAICTPGPVRRQQAVLALETGRHVLLERPPGETLTGLGDLIDMAQRARLTLFGAWPARFAAAAEPARKLLTTNGVTAVRIAWSEDAQHWHPSQGWIWQPGGLGVFHAGIDALALLTRFVPERLAVTGSVLSVPAGRTVPIAAELTLSGRSGLVVQASFDARPGSPSHGEIELHTGTKIVRLSERGAALAVDGVAQPIGPSHPYRGVYQRFARLAETGACDLDAVPLMQVADAYLLGSRFETEALGTWAD